MSTPRFRPSLTSAEIRAGIRNIKDCPRYKDIAHVLDGQKSRDVTPALLDRATRRAHARGDGFDPETMETIPGGGAAQAEALAREIDHYVRACLSPASTPAQVEFAHRALSAMLGKEPWNLPEAYIPQVEKALSRNGRADKPRVVRLVEAPESPQEPAEVPGDAEATPEANAQDAPTDAASGATEPETSADLGEAPAEAAVKTPPKRRSKTKA